MEDDLRAQPMEDDLREFCGLCRNPVNPGAVVCASCGAHREVTRRAGCLMTGISFLSFVGVTQALMAPMAFFRDEGFLSRVTTAAFSLGLAVGAFAIARVLWRRRQEKEPEVHWVKNV